MAYTRVNWQNTPSTATPLSADNLNQMDAGIEQNASDIADLQSHTYDATLDSTSTNAPQTRVVQSAFDTTNTAVTANTTAITALQTASGNFDTSITDLKVNVSTLFNGVKDDPNVAYTQCELANGTVANEGNTNAVYTTTYVPCVCGDIVTIHPVRPNADGCHYIYGFRVYDSEHSALATITTAETEYETYIVRPANSAYIRYTIFEVDASNQQMVLRYNTYGYTPYIEVKSGDSIDERITELETIATLDDAIALPFTQIDGYTINYASGTTSSNTTIFGCTDFIDISKYHSVSYRFTNSTSSSPTSGAAFYDSTKTYISGVRAGGGASEYCYSDELYTVAVPYGAVYARFSLFSDTETCGEFSVYGYSHIARIKDWVLNAYPSKTVNGGVITFSDGADNVPVKAMIVDINAEQELYGMAYPYPAGASANLIPEGTDTQNGYVNGYYLASDGTTVKSSTWYISEYFPVTAGETYTFSASSSMSSPSICYYDSSYTFISGIAGSDGNPNTITVPNGAVYARGSQRIKAWNAYTVQFELGDTATTPMWYSNVCPILGFDEVSIYRNKKNLLDSIKETTASGITFTPSPTGGLYLNGTATKTTSIALMQGYLNAGTYTIKGMTGASSSTYRIGYRYRHIQNSSYTAYVYASGSDVTFTLTEPVYMYVYLFVYAKAGELTNQLVQYQMEAGNASTSYEADMEKNDMDVSLGSAGTVYGGTLNITTGKLTVNKVKVVLDGTETWTPSTSSNVDTKYFGTTIGEYGYVVEGTAICDTYQRTVINGSQTTVGLNCFNSDGYNAARISIRPVNVTSMTVSEFKALLAEDPVTVVYELATPLTYQLTPTEIVTFLGNNTIQARTGNIETMTYHADTKIYIDNAIATAVASLS